MVSTIVSAIAAASSGSLQVRSGASRCLPGFVVPLFFDAVAGRLRLLVASDSLLMVLSKVFTLGLVPPFDSVTSQEGSYPGSMSNDFAIVGEAKLGVLVTTMHGFKALPFLDRVHPHFAV